MFCSPTIVLQENENNYTIKIHVSLNRIQNEYLLDYYLDIDCKQYPVWKRCYLHSMPKWIFLSLLKKKRKKSLTNVGHLIWCFLQKESIFLNLILNWIELLG